MEEQGKPTRREDVFSRAVRAGKRTYFFDVKATRNEELYLTITESKRRFSNEQGKFFYEKHKLFLYREDFEKFMEGLKESFDFIHNEQGPADTPSAGQSPEIKADGSIDVSFEDLDKTDDSDKTTDENA